MLQNPNQGLRIGNALSQRIASTMTRKARELQLSKVDARQKRTPAPHPRALPQGGFAQNFRSFTQ